MTPEERKEYNKVYYEVKRETILATLNKKVKCQKCSRIICMSSLKSHALSKLCLKFSNIEYV